MAKLIKNIYISTVGIHVMLLHLYIVCMVLLVFVIDKKTKTQGFSAMVRQPHFVTCQSCDG